MATSTDVSPFSWAKEFAANAEKSARQDDVMAQGALERVFATEAARQAPWSSLPVDLAKQNNASKNAFGNAVAAYDYKQSNKPLPDAGKIGNMITSAARAAGLDPDMMLTYASRESKFDPNAVSPTGAYGLFQLTQGYSRDNGVTDRRDINQNIQGAMVGTRKNVEGLAEAHIPIDAGTVYLAHNQGLAGAKALLNPANRNVDAVVALAPAYGGDVNKARSALAVNGYRPGMTASAFAQFHMAPVNREYQRRKELRKRNPGSDAVAALMDIINKNKSDNSSIEDDANSVE